MDIDFDCTGCGACCHGLRLPLTLAETREWLAAGHDVQLLCEALPWEAEPAPGDAPAAHRRRRSFAATSGRLALRVTAILVAAFAGPCPNLGPDRRCGIYGQRPLVCRIYPAEINPFIALQPSNKACPPEAWAAGHSPLLRGARIVDAATQGWIEASRAADAREVDIKQRLCEALGIEAAGLVGEGFVAHTPARARLAEALEEAGSEATAASRAWRIVSNQGATARALAARGADAVAAPGGCDYLPLLAETL